MAFRTMITELHSRLEKAGFADVRPAYGFVLLYVREHDAGVQEIAELMGTSKQAASKLLAGMEAARLVERVANPEDRRARRVLLTKRGRRMLSAVEAIYRDLEAEWADVVGARELERVRTHLVSVVRAAHDGELPALRPVW